MNYLSNLHSHGACEASVDGRFGVSSVAQYVSILSAVSRWQWPARMMYSELILLNERARAL